MRPLSTSAIIPLLLATVLLFSPLVAGYAWAEGRHTNESHVHQHHLLEQLAPSFLHHPVSPVVGEESQGLQGHGQGSNAIALIAAAMIAAPLMITAAPTVSASPLNGSAALPTVITSSIALSYLRILLWIYLMRPHHQLTLLWKPPMPSL